MGQRGGSGLGEVSGSEGHRTVPLDQAVGLPAWIRRA
jgi:hypothetical protein